MVILYTVVLAILIDTINSTGANDIRLPPTITRHPTAYQIYKKRAESVLLECVAAGSPAPRYDWTKNGQPLGSVSNIVFVGNGTLQISHLMQANEGIYQCFASNIYGRTMSSFAELWMSRTDPSSLERNQISAVEGEPFVIVCRKTMNCFPAPHYSWKLKNSHQSSPVLIDRRRQIDQNGNLHFAYMTVNDATLSGLKYACYLKNSIEDVTYPGSYTQLTVMRARQVSVSAPLLAFSTEDELTVLQGQNAVLRCFFYGYPVPTVTWSRDSAAALPIGRHQTSLSGTRLTLLNVTASDAGVYRCRGQNSNSSTYHRILLVVGAVPVFTPTEKYESLHNINVTDGDTVNFTCRTSAQPSATVVWLRNTQPLTVDSSHEKYSVSADGARLTVFNVCRDCADNRTDLQVIQCNASNQHGYSFAAGYINVLRRTRLVVRPQNTTVNPFNLFAREEVLWCVASSDPSTPSSIVWYHRPTNGTAIQLNTSARLAVNGDGSLIFRDIAQTEWHQLMGWYRCVADNGYTSDSAKMFLNVLASPIVPTRPTDKAGVVESGVSPWWVVVLVILAVIFISLIVIYIVIRFCCCRGDIYQLDAIEQRDGKRPLKELEERSLKPYKRREDTELAGSRASLDNDDDDDDID